MLRLLLDEHISPGVAAGLRRRSRALTIHTMQEWENGSFLGQDDAACLEAAGRQRLPLVTYDRRTIPPLLKVWAEEGRAHAGVIFVDDKTVSPADVGGLVVALTGLAREMRTWDWTDRICFLRR
jgi:hypothetical protein